METSSYLLLKQYKVVNNAKQSYWRLPLIKASATGRAEIVSKLLNNGVNVNSYNDFGETALMVASMLGYVKIVSILMEYGALLNMKSNCGDTALIWASLSGRTEIVSKLLENGANIDIKDNNGITALVWATRHKHFRIMKLIQHEKSKIIQDVNLVVNKGMSKNGSPLVLHTHRDISSYIASFL